MSHSQIQCPTHVHWDTHMRLGCSGLGPDTVAAIREVAYEHPDADADCIAAAYDAFEREHGD